MRYAVATPRQAWLLRRADGSQPSEGIPEQDLRAQTSEQPRRVIVCAACEHPVTDPDARIEMAGRHEHTCVNPSGYVYRIGCFRRAPGCVGAGQWSGYYSWFDGYVWQVACCASCSMHLGWGFELELGATAPEDRFHGLIVDRITEVEQPAGPDAS